LADKTVEQLAGERLVALMNDRNIRSFNQLREQLERRFGRSFNDKTIARHFRAETQMGIGDLKLYAEFFGVPMSYILGEVPPPTASTKGQSFRLGASEYVSEDVVRLSDLRLERLELLEREQTLASERRRVLDEEIKVLEEKIRKRGESDEGHG
jgi:hypothetical protein